AYALDEILNAKPVTDDQGRIFQVGRQLWLNPLTSPIPPQTLTKWGSDLTAVWSQPITPEAQWTLDRDPKGNVYLAGTNGMVAQFNTDGMLIWSNNFGRECVAMKVDPLGNRFLSFADGSIARLQS